MTALTGKTVSSFRRKRTRTMIQMGALIERVTLMASLEIEAGDDLQDDPEQAEKAATLLGALYALVEILKEPAATQQKHLWAQKGKELFGEKTKGKGKKNDAIESFAELKNEEATP